MLLFAKEKKKKGIYLLSKLARSLAPRTTQDMPFLLTCDLLSAQWHIEDSYTIFSRNFQGHCIQLLHLWSNENKEICGFRVLQNATTINNFPVDSRFKLFLPIQKISSSSVDYLGQENLVDKGRISSVKDLES